MCAIIASKDPEKVLELIEVNSYRGSFSWSITGIDENYMVAVQEKGFGEFPEEEFRFLASKCDEGLYWVCHVQAPTNGLIEEYDRIHPVEISHEMLWHNGIIKDKWVKEAMEDYDLDDNFDTRALLTHISASNRLDEALVDVDGSFACVYLKEGEYLKVFRNSASPLHCFGTDFSSVKFGDMESINSNVIYDIDLDVMETQPEGTFDNINEPFYFGGFQ